MGDVVSTSLHISLFMNQAAHAVAKSESRCLSPFSRSCKRCVEDIDMDSYMLINVAVFILFIAVEVVQKPIRGTGEQKLLSTANS